MTNNRGTLGDKEIHPAAESALRYIKNLGYDKLVIYQEAFASCAIEGNRLGEICSETLSRVFSGAGVSDRYILGLAWAIKSMEEHKEEEDGSENLVD